MESDLFMQIEYNPTEYKTLETQNMDPELSFKLVKFDTGYYGIISHNPTNDLEEVVLVSPDKDNNFDLFDGLGCRSFIVFARDAKKYMENAPRELLVILGDETPEEFREIITKDDERTLKEKVELCIERMEMKHENSFFNRYADIFATIFLCVTAMLIIICILNILHIVGLI